jgi:pimeloyl-ACP methyl ester carboxylesterase
VAVVIGAEDRIVPADLQRFMAERAGARHVLELPGASHALSVSQPQETANVIREAAALRVPV